MPPGSRLNVAGFLLTCHVAILCPDSTRFGLGILHGSGLDRGHVQYVDVGATEAGGAEPGLRAEEARLSEFRAGAHEGPLGQAALLLEGGSCHLGPPDLVPVGQQNVQQFRGLTAQNAAVEDVLAHALAFLSASSGISVRRRGAGMMSGAP